MDIIIFYIFRHYCPLHRVRQPGTKTPFGMIATLRLQITNLTWHRSEIVMALASAEDKVVPSQKKIRIVEDIPGSSTSSSVSLTSYRVIQ